MKSSVPLSLAALATLCLFSSTGFATSAASTAGPKPGATKSPHVNPGKLPTAKPKPTPKLPQIDPNKAKPTQQPKLPTQPKPKPKAPQIDPSKAKPTKPLPGPKPTPKLPSKIGSPLFSKDLNDGKTSLRGFVDLHTHPMSHLGFGGHVLHGAPDVGITMPAGSIYDDNDCNHNPVRAKSIAEALGSCYSTHAGHDLIRNKCGNHIRRMVLNGLEDGNQANKTHDIDHPPGYPSFSKWPKHDDILHQQMWVDWIERSYQGGMRVMVALAVNNYTLATGLETSANNPRNDKASADLQIRELKRLVAKHKWMEIAYSAEDLRRIVGQKDKLAVIIGVELDDIGDFVVNKSRPSPQALRAELRRLHRRGVRYIFPMHLTDNYFGGTAAYEKDVNRANCYHYGSWWDLACTDGSGRDEHGITKRVDMGFDVFTGIKLGECGGTAPVPKCRRGEGHVNRRGLTSLGREAIDEMMRLGMIIDMDHASVKTIHGILDQTAKPSGGKYPLVSGHNGLRGADAHANSENNRTKAQYLELTQRKGIAGVGWGALRSDEWLRRLQAVRNTGVPLALGSDINGLVVQPRPRAGCSPQKPCVTYSSSFPQPQHGSKTWDYNRDGVAHIGLFPDLLRDIEGQKGGPAIVDTLFDGAEAFAVMWERAERIGRTVPEATSSGMSIVKAEYGRNCGLSASKANIKSWVSEQCVGKQRCTYNFTWAPWGGDPSPSLCKKEIDITIRCGSSNKRTKVMHERTPQGVSLRCD